MRRSTLILAILSALLIISSCSNPASDKPKAVINEATPVSTPANAVASPAAPAEKYLITNENSKLKFVASKITRTHDGSFEKFSGTIEYTGQPETSKVTIIIQTDSVKADDPDLTKHLKTPDFFDVARYPQATFTSTEIKPGSNQGASHSVTGTFELHGVTKSITFPATITVTPEAISVDSTFSINRKDFAINYAGAADNLIRDEVVLTLQVRATK
jgi:polyisoprenoid-binding protein YceI